MLKRQTSRRRLSTIGLFWFNSDNNVVQQRGHAAQNDVGLLAKMLCKRMYVLDGNYEKLKKVNYEIYIRT